MSTTVSKSFKQNKVDRDEYNSDFEQFCLTYDGWKKSKRGTMKQNIYHNDCFDIFPQIENKSVDLILTDPPYNIINQKGHSKPNFGTMRENSWATAKWDEYDNTDFYSMLDNFLSEAGRVIKDKGSLIVFTGYQSINPIIELAEKHNFYFKCVGVWHKTNPMPANMNLHFIHSIEFYIYFVYGSRTGTFNNNGKAIHNYFECSVTPLSERKYGKHQTQKPEKLISWLTELLSNPGDIVLDPFMGAGTTCVCAKKLGRGYIGIEKEKEFYDISEKRLDEINEWRKEGL